MRLRSGKSLPNMDHTPSRNLPPPQNNAPNSKEQPVKSTTSNVGTSTSIGEMPTIISQITKSTISPEMVVSLSQVKSAPTTPRATQNMIGDQRPHCPLSFTLPINGREQPYGIPTKMMASLRPSASMYVDNSIATTSLLIHT